MKKELYLEGKQLAKDIIELFDVFRTTINPSINFANKTSRSAAEWMINRWGKEAVIMMAKKIVSVQGKEFAPTATNPYEMKEKLAKFALYFERNNKPKPKMYEA